MSIQERLNQVQANIRQTVGERPVTLVAVSKYAALDQMIEAYEAGVRHFGENKIQDALAKMESLPTSLTKDVQWHFIGNLQSNKVNKTIGRFSCLHAVDSIPLAQSLSKANKTNNMQQPILIQINSTTDLSRHGVQPKQAKDFLSEILPLQGISIRGLMTMAPAEASMKEDSATLEKIFCGLSDLRDELKAELAIDLPDLSMGMSHDYVHALKCGATIIRIGNVLFKN
jgi:PLP dependent protein